MGCTFQLFAPTVMVSDWLSQILFLPACMKLLYAASRCHPVFCVKRNSKQTNKQREETDAPSQQDLAEQKNAAQACHQSSGKKHVERLLLHRAVCKHHLPPIHPFRLVVSLPIARKVQLLRDGNPRQTDILHHGPDNGQATGFRGEGVNLIRAPSNMTKQAFNRIGATNVAMHDLWKGIKRQKMLFIFAQCGSLLGSAGGICL